jgi:sulfotransferase 6B1
MTFLRIQPPLHLALRRELTHYTLRISAAEIGRPPEGGWKIKSCILGLPAAQNAGQQLMSIKSSLRSLVYQTKNAAQGLRFASASAPEAGWPVLLGISFPKSGTHLLDQILLGFARVAPFGRRLHSFYAEYEGESGIRQAPEQAAAWLDSLQARDIASAHLFAEAASVRRVTAPRFIPYFIFRDPRDVVVSHVFYVTDMEARHVHHAYYAALPDFDARLQVSILGRSGLDIEFPDIAQRFAPYLGWLDQAAVLKIHFEDLVHDRPATLERILDRFLARVPLALPRGTLLEALETSIDPAKSPTFRSGKTGEWKKLFTARHKRIFKDVAGDLLQRLGYEKSNDW